MPYQLASPEFLPETDTARDAAVTGFPVQPGDGIVVASDGLFDNMWPEQVVSVLQAKTLNKVRLPVDGHKLVGCTRAKGFIGHQGALCFVGME